MMFEVWEAVSAAEVEQIIKLRYEVLRKPWNQPADTAFDDLESTSINLYISENEKVIACGRLQKNSASLGQIRYMAVDPGYQGKGLGKLIVTALEAKARDTGLTEIELQARENALEFYKVCGYHVKEKSFLLWGIIQHYLMGKNIGSHPVEANPRGK